MPTLPQKNLLTREEAAEYLDIKPGTLEVWACTGRENLPFVKIGRAVRYKLADLDAYIERQTVRRDQH